MRLPTSFPLFLKTGLAMTLIGLFVACTEAEYGDGTEAEGAVAAIETGLLPGVVLADDTLPRHRLPDRMRYYEVPGVSIAVIENGKLRWAAGYGMADTETGRTVTDSTLFQAGSISKPVAALAVLKLWEEGRVDLDRDVNEYLTDWRVPENRFTEQERVTLRRLLTHTAGTTVHGFPGYAARDSFPSLTDVLTGAGNTAEIGVDTFPGSQWRYSGGGFTVMEKVVEDVTGKPFDVYLREAILDPLGMTSSTFTQPLPPAYHERASAAYDGGGALIEGKWHNYPERAAAGLWTTPSDLAKFCLEIQAILAGKSDGLLRRETVEAMLTPDLNDWGLGVGLTGTGDTLVFQHGGKNAGFTNMLMAYAHRGHGVIVMTNADRGGSLMMEVVRGVSDHYDWGLAEPRVVTRVPLGADSLAALAGTYRLDGLDLPDDYFVEMVVEDGGLRMNDANDTTSLLLMSLGDLRFITLEEGDRATFELGEGMEVQQFLWNDRYAFVRVPD